jgi:YD repeat-containing protein
MLGIARPLAISLLVIAASAACGAQHPGPAPDQLARSAPRAAVSHPPWRPLHKGGADLSTGVYIREDDDLVVDTPMPIVLRRTYNSADGHSRQFGTDTTHPGEWWIYGDGDRRVPWGDLILADGGRIHFVRISPGDTQTGAVLRHDSTPTEFNGALLGWTGSRWEMRFRDGSVASFLDCQKASESCSLVERRDPDGHRVAYVRDASGTLRRMESEGRSIAFDYDDHKRIVRAYDTSQRQVSYTYDERGRLVRAAGTDGVVRGYEYDDHNKLVGIREPGRIVQNWFDEAGRWVRQVVKDSDDDADPYVITARYVVENGAIVESSFDEGNGLTVERYNAHHYIVSETIDAESPSRIVFAYDRDAVSNVLNNVTMSCLGSSGPMTRVVQLPPRDADAAKAALIRENCVWRR